jgi:hypothetical protein
MLRAVCVASLLLALSSGTFAQDHSGEILITLERIRGYGSQPMYKVKIHGDGSVIYEGENFVRVAGRQERKIDPAEVQGLVRAFLEIDYFGLQDGYLTMKNEDGTETTVTDLPTTKTSLSFGEKSKSVEDYVDAPEKLGDLERKIDEVVGTKRWVSIDPPSLHEEYLRGWNVRGPEAQALLCQAAQAGDAEVVKAFIDHGADVNVSIDSQTPLQFARGVQVVQLLITAGANVNAPSETMYGAPLGYAANRGDVASINALLKAGAKVNGTSLGGRTPLMQAAESGNPEAVKALLLAGADVQARDDDGQDALKHARFGLTSNDNSPFASERVPDYRSKFKIIEGLLRAAGASGEHLEPE